MTTIIRGSDNFDTATLRLLDSSSDVSSGGDSKSKNIDVTLSSGAKLVIVDFLLQASDDNTTFFTQVGNGSIATSGYTWVQDYQSHAATPATGHSGGTGATEIQMFGGLGNATDEMATGTIRYQIGSAVTWVTFQIAGANTTALGYSIVGSGYQQDTADRIRFGHNGATDSWAEGWYIVREWVP